MRKQMRRLIVIMLLIFGLIGENSVVYANTNVEEGISVSVETDKDAYKKNEEITIVTTIKNLKGVSIQDLSLENIVPDGFKVTNETKKELEKKELKSGEEIILSTTIVEGKNNTGIVIGIAAFMVIVVVGILFFLKQKKKAVALMVLFALGINTLGLYGTSIAYAVEEKEVSKEAIFNYDSEEVKVLTKVDYREEVPVSNEENVITKGEWIKTLLEKMETSLIDVEDGFSYYYSDTKESEYGVAVETAHVRGILPKRESTIFGVNEVADREFVAYTVYYLMGFDGEYALECRDKEELSYKSECALLVHQGFLSLINGNFMPKNALTEYDKEQIFEKIDYFNSSLDISAMKEVYHVAYADGVVLLETESYECIENDESCTLVLNDDTDVSELKNGIIFVITQKQPYEMCEAFKVSTIQVEDGKTTIECIRPQIDEVVKEYRIVGSTYLEPSVIIPEAGVEVETISNDMSMASLARGGIKDKIKLGKIKFSLKDKIGEKSGVSVEGSFAVEVPEIAFLLEGDGLNIDEFTFSVSSREKLTGLKVMWGSEMEGGAKIEEERIKIATIPAIPVAVGATIKANLYIEVGISGEISLSWEMESLNGFQYKDGAFRDINDTTVNSKEINIQADVKVGLAPNVSFSLLGMDIAGIDVGGGLAGEVSKKWYTDVVPNLECSDVAGYVYLNLRIDKESMLGQLLKKLKVSISKDIWKPSNSPWKKLYHMENGVLRDDCTYGKGHIFGCIVDGNGKAIQDAKIVITQMNGSYTVEGYSAISESAEYEVGEFGFENVPIGEYKIEVTLGTSYYGSSTVTVEKGKRIDCGKIVVVKKTESNDKEQVPTQPQKEQACKHSFSNATCTEPSVCTKCGITNSVALGHDFQNQKTCSRCGVKNSNYTYMDWRMDGTTLIISGSGPMDNWGYWDHQMWIKAPWKEERVYTVVIEDGITSIGDGAFMEMWDLKTVSIPSSITRIGESAFDACGISEITIPNSVKTIDSRAFEQTSIISITIPNSVTSIGDCLFFMCYDLKNVVMSENVTYIPEATFMWCQELESVKLSNRTTYIGPRTFESCENLSSIIIPTGVTKIEYRTFFGTAISNITLPEGVTSIGEEAFACCDNLSSIVIPNSVTYIDNSAFYGCEIVTIYGTPGSYAQTYAIKNGISFVAR